MTNLELTLWTHALVAGTITAMIAFSKGRTLSVLLWFLFGSLFSVVAITAAILAEPLGKDCTECCERIKQDARKCPHCGSRQHDREVTTLVDETLSGEIPSGLVRR